MAALRSGHDSVMNFTNTGVTFGIDPLRSRLDCGARCGARGSTPRDAQVEMFSRHRACAPWSCRGYGRPPSNVGSMARVACRTGPRRATGVCNRGTPVSSAICRRLIQAMVNPSGLPPAMAASTTCPRESTGGRRGSRSRCPPRRPAWAGGRLSPSRPFLRRRRAGRRHRTRARHAHSGRHLEPLQDLSRSRIDSPQLALVTFQGAVPELAVDPGDPGDEALGLDGAKNGPCLGIDLMDLPVPILPHRERPFGPRERRITAAAGCGDRGDDRAACRIWECERYPIRVPAEIYVHPLLEAPDARRIRLVQM
jgi:hypothetical protein